MLYIAVEGFSDGPGNYPGQVSELGVWDAKRLIDEARSDGALEFFSPPNQKDADVADDLLGVLHKWRAFRFPPHERGSGQPTINPGDKVLVIRALVNPSWWEIAQRVMSAGGIPQEEPKAGKNPHVVLGKGDRRFRVIVGFKFSQYQA